MLTGLWAAQSGMAQDTIECKMWPEGAPGAENWSVNLLHPYRGNETLDWGRI